MWMLFSLESVVFVVHVWNCLAWRYYRDLSCLGTHPKVAGFYVTARVTGQSNHLRLLTSVIGYICHPRRHATAALSSIREAQDVIICHILLGKCPGMLQDPRSCSLNNLLLRQALMHKGFVSWAAYPLPWPLILSSSSHVIDRPDQWEITKDVPETSGLLEPYTKSQRNQSCLRIVSFRVPTECKPSPAWTEKKSVTRAVATCPVA